MNVKSGDLAICINTELERNHGVIVKVLRPHVNSADWNFGSVACWWCESDEVMTWFFRSSGITFEGHAGPVPDACLRPIRPQQPRPEEAMPANREAELA